jgi:hypothetical protein
MVSGVLGVAVVGCGDSSDPGTNSPVAGSSGSGSGGGGASSAGSTSGGTAGASGSAAAGGGAGGSSSGAGGGGGGAAAGGGAGNAGGGAGGGGAGGSGGSANGTEMSFFVTSEPLNGTGKLGGLAGADAHCKALATAAGAKRTQWVAYLSVAGTHAKDRIQAGPWYNQKKEVFAANQAALHALPAITQGSMASRDAYIEAKPDDALFMDEKGMAVPAAQHDILTGSNPDGTLLAGSTCMDWTSDSADDMAMLGHSDTPGSTQYSPSWNAAHESSGCDAPSLVSTGGEGRLYCFATD